MNHRCHIADPVYRATAGHPVTYDGQRHDAPSSQRRNSGHFRRCLRGILLRHTTGPSIILSLEIPRNRTFVISDLPTKWPPDSRSMASDGQRGRHVFGDRHLKCLVLS